MNGNEKEEEYYYERIVGIPLYRGNLRVIFSNSVEKIKERVKSFDSNPIYAHSYWDCIDGMSGVSLIFNPSNEFRRVYPGTIAHECIHFSHFILGDRGVKADFDNDEAMCYLTEWAVDVVYDFISELREKGIVLGKEEKKEEKNPCECDYGDVFGPNVYGPSAIHDFRNLVSEVDKSGFYVVMDTPDSDNKTVVGVSELPKK